MASKFEVHIEAERYIHNDLSNCAWDFQQRMIAQFENEDTGGVYHTMVASLIFSSFSVEAKVNFVGWKVLEAGWPERANLREKIDLLLKVLELDLNWGSRPLQTIGKLKRFRDTLAHGKPEIVDTTKIVDIEPEIWDALKSQWEHSVKKDFVNICREDEDDLWNKLLEAAKIDRAQTLTHGGHSLQKIAEGPE